MRATHSHESKHRHGCAPSTPQLFARSELGMRTLVARRDQLMLGYWRRLCAAIPERLLSRVFRARVAAVKQSESVSKNSLAAALLTTLRRYDLEEQWDAVATDQLYTADEWRALVTKAVLAQEESDRRTEAAERPSLHGYAAELMPRLETMASYLHHSRNQEGVWLRCRLRSDTLPLMHTIGKQCEPRWNEIGCYCQICPQPKEPTAEPTAERTAETGRVESAQHFLTDCRAPRLMQLRVELIHRLRTAIEEMERRRHERRCALLAEAAGGSSGSRNVGHFHHEHLRRLSREF